MRLNPDCIRAVLLEIEKQHTITQRHDGTMRKGSVSIYNLYNALLSFSNEDIFYAVYNLDQAGYLCVSIQWLNNVATECEINHITYEGHEFLDRIRDEKRWAAIQRGMSAVASYSLSAINALAEGAISGAVSAYLDKL